MLTSRDIAKMLDHSTLQPFLTEKDIRHGCEVAIKYGTATVCARPQDMEIVVPMLNGTGVLPCTVIGFPHGAHTMEIKAMEAARALEDGCRELDMVINIGALKDQNYTLVYEDIKAVVDAAHPKAIVKVIIETSALTDEEKVIACELAKRAKADFVKTSTGFAKGGATAADIALMRRTVGAEMGVKASGGVRSKEDAEKLVKAGASRLGASASIKIVSGKGAGGAAY